MRLLKKNQQAWVCRVCETKKPMSEFSKGTSRCKECKKKYLRTRYYANIEREREQARKYRESHADERYAYKRDYYSVPENREKRRVQEAKRKLQAWGSFAPALIAYRELEKFLKDAPVVLAAVPERRYNKRHRDNDRRKKGTRYHGK